MTHDDDLIRRGDALKALDWGDIYGRNAQDAIAALPAAVPAVRVDAEKLARLLFPDDYHDGSDCMNEVGRVGLPCGICAGKAEWWAMKVKEVADAAAAATLDTPAPAPTLADKLAALDEIARLGQEFDAETEAGASVIRGLVEAAEASKGMLAEPAPDVAGPDWKAVAWQLRGYAVHDDDCKVNKPPHFDVTKCTCGLRAALAAMEGR